MDIDQEYSEENIKALKAFEAGEGRLTFNELFEVSRVLLEAYEALDEKLKEQFTPQPMETAPTDGTDIWILTSDFGWVEGHWCAETEDFYKSQEGWASYDPDNSMGTWVTNYGDTERDRRMYCGMTPTAWMPKLPTLRGKSDEQ